MDFPDCPVVKTPSLHCRGHRFDPELEKFLMPHSTVKTKKHYSI